MNIQASVIQQKIISTIVNSLTRIFKYHQFNLTDYLNLKIFGKSGVIIIQIGFLMLMLAGYNILTHETIDNFQNLNLIAERSHTFELSPKMGISTMFIGCLMVLISTDSLISGYMKKNRDWFKK